MLAHAVADVASARVVGREVGSPRKTRVVRRRQVGRPADHVRQLRHDRVEDLALCLARGHRAGGVERRQARPDGVPVVGKLTRDRTAQARRLGRESLGVPGQPGLPLALARRACGHGLAEPLECRRGHDERRRRIAPVPHLGAGNFRVAERRPVRLGRPLLRRAAVADHGPNPDEARPRGLGARRIEGAPHRSEVVAIALDRLHEPAVRLVPLRHVFRERQRGRPVDRDAVVVVQDDEVRQTEVPRQRTRLGRDAFFEAAVAGDDIDPVIEQREAVAVVAGGERALRDRHPDTVGHALAQRAGRRLDAGNDAVLGVAGRQASPLTEPLELVERHRVAGEVEQAVQQHRTMASRQDEPITVRPRRVGRVVRQVLRPQQVGRRRHPHRHPRVTRLRLLDGIHGEGAQRVDARLVERRLARVPRKAFVVAGLVGWRRMLAAAAHVASCSSCQGVGSGRGVMSAVVRPRAHLMASVHIVWISGRSHVAASWPKAHTKTRPFP